MLQKISLFFLFYLAWFLCIGLGNFGAYFALVILVASFLWLKSYRLKNLHNILFIFLVGTLFDNILHWLGLYSFPNGLSWIIPLWLWVIWGWFSFVLATSLRWITEFKIWQQSIIGAIGFPVAYIGGHLWRPERMQFSLSLLSMTILLVFVWAVLFPIMCSFAKRVTDAS